MHTLILAGGFATRLWPLTEHRAKPLLLIDGQTILAHILQRVPTAWPVTIITNSLFANDFRAEVTALGRPHTTIWCEDAHSDQQKLGALRCISVCVEEQQIRDDLLILAGDNLLPQWQPAQMGQGSDTASLCVRQVPDRHTARRFGVVEVAADGHTVIGFAEKPPQPKSTLVSTAFLRLGGDLIPLLHSAAATHPDKLGEIFPALLAAGVCVQAVTVGGGWYDVGSFSTYLAAHCDLQPQPTTIHPTAQVSDCTFHGRVYIGAGCQLHGCRLTDCIVYPQVTLSDVIASRSVIDTGSQLRGVDLTGKLIRHHTVI